jgi:6-phosphogluconolactonase (cycloisomerase 2 family)
MRNASKVVFTAVLAAAVGACSDTNPVTAPGEEPESSLSAGHPPAGAVYLATNATAGNQVLVLTRASDGRLSAPRAFATGGTGTGGGLGNQGGVVLARENRRLLVVNAGSNDVSVFAVRSNGVKLLDRVPSGGQQPISVTVFRHLVYVLNAGGSGNISGFSLDRHGKLHPLRNSTRPLSTSASDPAQIEFTPAGGKLVVTEKATNIISTYRVNDFGRPRGPKAQPSVGATPFGFAFDHNGTLVVSEAFGGAPNASALSSYRLPATGPLQVVSGSVGTTETAACWVVITGDGRYAYTSNTGSGSISGYRIRNDGSLSLLNADGVTGVTGAGPIDLALSSDDRYLYSLDSGSGTISAFRVRANGSLAALAGVSGIPAGANGLAAR